MHIDPHEDIAEREEEDEREAIALAIARLNENRRHSAEVKHHVKHHWLDMEYGNVSSTISIINNPHTGTLCLQLHLPKVPSMAAVLDVSDKETILVDDLPLPHHVEKRRLLVHHSMETEEQNNMKLLTKIRERMQKWGISLLNTVCIYIAISYIIEVWFTSW